MNPEPALTDSRTSVHERIAVRDATRDDIAFLVDCNASMAWETERKSLDRLLLQSGITAVLDRPERGFYLIAEQTGMRVGCLLITREWSDWRNGDWWWLQSVYVLEQARRHGVFRALHGEVERRARLTPDTVGLRLYVERENLRAQATYSALEMTDSGYLMLERSLHTPRPF